MTYFEDLSFFRYSDASWALKNGYPYVLLNVGWLDKTHQFPTGKIKDKNRILYGVYLHCQHAVNYYRGFHACQFCENPPDSMMEVSYYTKKFKVGNGEIFVKGMNNIVYVAPTMIYHYIQAHDYLPPSEFLDALRRGGSPFDEFHKLEQEHLAKPNKPSNADKPRH